MANLYIMNKLYNFYLKNHGSNSQVMTAAKQLTLLDGCLLYGSIVILQQYFDRWRQQNGL
jgi:hypothetical protein